jgi:5-methylcytosine-specific restriction enzyme A
MFEPGRVYRRSELHHEWSGTVELQRQGGILTPTEAPLVIVVTGEEGEQYGYADFLDDEGVFRYYGAGQVGDMEFVRGNRALRDHAEAGEDVHLFEQLDEGLRYRGQVVVAGSYDQEGVPDRNGDPRRAIVFQLVALGDAIVTSGITETTTSEGSRWTMSLDDLRDRAMRAAARELGAGEAKRRTYARSDDLRVYVLRRANGACEGCNTPAPFVTKVGRPYLEPHHTRKLSDGGPDDPHHVIGLCPNCHRRVHHGVDGDEYNLHLQLVLKTLEPFTTS